MAAITNALG